MGRLTKYLYIIALVVLFFISNLPVNAEGKEKLVLDTEKISRIEKIIKDNMETGQIPGMSIGIVRGDEILYQKSMGYSDVENKVEATNETLYELASNSKQITALGIFVLQGEGKLDINDNVSEYIPWFSMKYRGKEQNITIKQLLNFTSGISFNAIEQVQAGDSERALEELVKRIMDTELVVMPGREFIYSTVSYDVLGLVIQYVSSKSYEDFIQEDVLAKFDMAHTYANHADAVKVGMMDGYKLGFLKARKYVAEEYRCNTPAGYIVSNLNDLCNYLKVINGYYDNCSIDKETLDAYRSFSWEIGKDRVIDSGGSNPSFSTGIMLVPEDSLAVVVMANRGSTGDGYVGRTAKEITRLLSGCASINVDYGDFDSNLDQYSTYGVGIFGAFTLIEVIMIIFFLIQLKQKKKEYRKGFIAKTIFSVIFLGFIGFIIYVLYHVPDIIFYGVSWNFIKVWGPYSVIPAFVLLASFIVLVSIHLMLKIFFKKKTLKRED